MRPSILTPLFASVQSLAGVGPRVAVLLKKALRLPTGVTEPRVIDLLWTGLLYTSPAPQK
nr:MAG: hypothetical protein DIU57_06930 [Pseudomonadota bacterium]